MNKQNISITSFEIQIQELRYKLSKAEEYISYLEKDITDCDNKLKSLKNQITNLTKASQKDIAEY